jgi:hypothetical protein
MSTSRALSPMSIRRHPSTGKMVAMTRTEEIENIQHTSVLIEVDQKKSLANDISVVLEAGGYTADRFDCDKESRDDFIKATEHLFGRQFEGVAFKFVSGIFSDSFRKSGFRDFDGAISKVGCAWTANYCAGMKFNKRKNLRLSKEPKYMGYPV